MSDYEIILLNDGSTDNSLTICKAFVNKFGHIRLYSQKHEGLSSVRNLGLSKARGRYIYFVDVDDYLAFGSLGTILKTALLNDLDILGFNYIRTSRNDLTEPLNLEKRLGDLHIKDGPEYLEDSFFSESPWWFIFKRSLWRNIKLWFDERLYVMEDTIFTTSLFLSAKRIAFIDAEVYRYYKNPNSMMLRKENEHYLRVIDSMRKATVYLGRLIRSQHKKHLNSKTTTRLRSRQESFLFFMIIRAIKSTMSFEELQAILKDKKDQGIYPMHNFIGSDYNKLSHKILCPLLNNRASLLICFWAWRTLSSLGTMLFRKPESSGVGI